MPSPRNHYHLDSLRMGPTQRRQVRGGDLKFRIQQGAVNIDTQQTDGRFHSNNLSIAPQAKRGQAPAQSKLHTSILTPAYYTAQFAWDRYSFSRFRGGESCCRRLRLSTSSGAARTPSGCGSSSSAAGWALS